MALVLALLNCSREPGSLSFADWGKGRVVRELDAQVGALGLGTHTGTIDVQRDPAPAAGLLVIAAGAGAVGGTIGGKLVTAAWTGTDAASADLVAAAINADATANQFVSAVSRIATQTVTLAGAAGVVSVTVNAPSGTVNNVSAAAPKTYSTVWATSDTATAAALVALINADGASPVFASSAAGIITLYCRPNGTQTGAANTLDNLVLVSAAGTGVTAGGAALAGGGTAANVLVSALMPGTVGKGITLAASGTGVTAPTGANLLAGVGAPGNSFTC